MTQELLTLTITDLSRAGSGVARDESGRVIFVPFTAPGDRVRVRITETQKRYAQGELLEILAPSEIRQTPPCPLFGRCGGCQWQHLPYELQWKTKAGGVRHALERVQVPIPTEFEELPAERIWEYRNRIQLRGERGQVGFFAPRSHDLIPADGCRIARPEINAAWQATAEEGARLPRPFKVELEVLPSGEVRRVWNSPHGAAGFRQIHDEQNAKMVNWISRNITSGQELLDLFGGNGNLSLPLTGRMPLIHCVDVSAPKDPPAGTPPNLQFHRSAVLSWLLRFSGKVAENQANWPRSVVLDPPREGLGRDFTEIAKCLEKVNATEIIAVGCDPDSWARDVARFVRRGWKLEKAAVLDFFPQTPHVESVALLRR